MVIMVLFREKIQKILYYIQKERVLSELFYIAEALTGWQRLGMPNKSGRVVSAKRRLMAFAIFVIIPSILVSNKRYLDLNPPKALFSKNLNMIIKGLMII